jgi:hypothetical protein
MYGDVWVYARNTGRDGKNSGLPYHLKTPVPMPTFAVFLPTVQLNGIGNVAYCHRPGRTPVWVVVRSGLA